MIHLALWAWLAAVPTQVTLEPAAEVRQLVADTWASLEASTGLRSPEGRARLVVERSSLAAGRGGASVPGVISLRQAVVGVLSQDERVALKHEVAHQFLLRACAAASDDRLFHEGFALSASGELARWKEDGYQSLSEAAKTLSAAKSVDPPAARKALARMLAETEVANDLFPMAVRSRFGSCDGKGAWPTLTIEALAMVRPGGEAATVVMSRHSGEVLWSKGELATPRPFGSTLKPFLLAASSARPRWRRGRRNPEWACGAAVPSMSAQQALLRSCNGYFLDWAQASPGVERFGTWGPVLTTLGLARLPQDMSEAIGLRTTLALSPLALAAAYRLLAEARPEVLELMKRNGVEGTLAGLPRSAALAGVATKTGTVRDGATRATTGWLVGVTEHLVVVMVVPERPPRQFLGEFVEALERARAVPGRDAVEVQVFGLLQPAQVDVRCARGGFAVSEEGPVALPTAFTPVAALMKPGKVLCLAAPFEVKLQGVTGTRTYAGVFRRDVPAPYVPAVGQNPSERERRARQGSELVFRTTRLSYVAGVLAAEDSSLTGEARAALARVISHNVDTRARHGSRPLCDTTHCQAFKGSGAPRPEDGDALGRAPLPGAEWLPFSRGGDEPWEQRRSVAETARALGVKWAAVRKLEGEGGTLRISRTEVEGDAPFEVVDEVPCERLRGPLRLPSCPSRVSWTADTVTFEGAGRGHGLGLEVEGAKKSGLGQEEILKRAYRLAPRTDAR